MNLIAKKISTPAPRNSRKTIFRREYLDLFLSSELAIDVKSNSKKMYRSAINRFFQYCKDKEIELATINRGTILEFRDTLKDDGKKATTVQNYISTLKIFFAWCAERSLYPNISHKIKSETPSRKFKKKALTVAESRKLLNSINTKTVAGKRDKAMIALMLICGLRTIEVSRANVGSLERSADGNFLHVHGKGRSDDADLIAIPPEVMQIIDSYLKTRNNFSASDPLFVSTSNRSRKLERNTDSKNPLEKKRLSTVSISSIAKKAMTAIGIEGESYTAHSLRHSAATNAILNGASLEEVSKLLRHKSLNTTMIYNHAIDERNNPSAKIVANAIFHSETPDTRKSSATTSASTKSKKKSKHSKPARRSQKSRHEDPISTSSSNSISVSKLLSALRSEGYRLI